MSLLRLTPQLLLLLPSLAAAAAPEGFEEKFALAPDRAAVLTDLVAGTPEYYYYAALHAQNSGQSAEVARLLKEWASRHPADDSRRALLENRQRFLDYAGQPDATLTWLRSELGLTFDHARQTAETPAEIPTVLDPALITWEAFLKLATAQDPRLSSLTDSGLRNLFELGLAKDLTEDARRAVLARLTRPDLPGLTDVLLADLKSKASGGFGEFPIHRQLLLEQLEALLRDLPALRENQVFVETWLSRLTPSDAEDPLRDPAVRLAWLDRQLAFTASLPPSFNSLKAAVLHQRLEAGLRRGEAGQALLLEYLKLPRQVFYLNPALREQPAFQRYPADLNADFTTLTGGGPVRGDEPLVRRLLLRLLAENPDLSPWQPWLEASWLNAVLAEARLTARPEEADRYLSLLPPSAWQDLRNRTDLEFDPALRTDWKPEDEVTLDLHVKNIPRLLVKVFEINTENVHRTTGRQVNTDLDLDGLTANAETAEDYTSPPLQRVRRTFKFPALNGRRGVWMIEFIGGGKSSRALIRKGGLTILPEPVSAGTRLTVLDEKHAPVPGASALLGTQRFPADTRGRILLPFSTTPGDQNVIVSDGAGFTTLESISLPGETYRLTAGIHVPRESLLPGATAPAILRPALLGNGRPLALSTLENAKLTLTATTLDGIATTSVFPLKDLKTFRETAVPFLVPDRLAKLDLVVSGEVKSLLTSQPVPVSASSTVSVSSLTATDALSALHLSPSVKGWTLSALGRNGEPAANRQLSLRILHPDFTVPVEATLRTDADGQALTGPLAGITSLHARDASGAPPSGGFLFPLPVDRATLPPEVHAAAGEKILLSWPGIPRTTAGQEAASVSLLETRQGLPVRRITEGVRLKDRTLELSGLEPGTYSLQRQAGAALESVTLRVAPGPETDGRVLNQGQTLELSREAPLAIHDPAPGRLTPSGKTEAVDVLSVAIGHATPDTRVHVLISRFLPETDAFEALGPDSYPEAAAFFHAWRPSLYQSARRIGDEYRYVLERRNLPAFAGNLLPRPGLLLNPWAIADTVTNRQTAAEGESLKAEQAELGKSTATRRTTLGRKMDETKDAVELRRAKNSEKSGLAYHNSAGDAPAGTAPPATRDLSFLAEPGSALLNLKPDAEGKVHIPATALGHGQFLRVLVLSGASAAVRDFPLPGSPLRTRDLRLGQPLDPATRFARQNAVTVLEKDTPFTLNQSLSSQFQVYSHLGEAWDLLNTVSKNGSLPEFAFLRTWLNLEEAAKRALYARYACHELNFFLSRKDPGFFQSVVRPFLASKRDRTFLDLYLLEANLSGFLSPARYDRLNTAEQLLLVRRLTDESHRTAAARSLTDFLDIKPRDPAREMFFFDTALSSQDLTRFRRNSGDTTEAGIKAALADDFADPFAARESAPAAPALSVAPLEQPAAVAGTARGLAVMERLQEEEQLLRQRAKQQVLHQQKELTKEWAENNYYKLLTADQNAQLIQPNRFWQDYARWDGKSPFLSAHLAEASGSFAEIMLALALTDLPLETAASPVRQESHDGTLTLTSGGQALVFHQEIKPADPDSSGPQLMVSQNFYLNADRFREENGERTDKFVSGEFLTGQVYGCQVVVTNSGSSRRRLEVLFQIPQGSIPVLATRTTQSVPVLLEGFRTQTLDFHFYFPQEGNFAHYPVQVSREGKTAASAAPATLQAVRVLSNPDRDSWAHVSQNGTADEVLAWLEHHNLFQTNLELAAWRLKDRGFYDRVLSLLRARKHHHGTVFSYSLLHKDLPAIRDYLAFTLPHSHPENLREPLDSPLLTVDPVEEKAFQWLEYSPLVNARAHPLGGGTPRIMNESFARQYAAFLHLLSFRSALTDEDRLGLTAALLLQDRLPEARGWIARVDPAKVHERLQFDYTQAWLALSAGDSETARRLSTAHAPDRLPDHWAAKFRELAAQLDEIDGRAPAEPRPEDLDAMQDRRAAAEPRLAVRTENKAVLLDCRNVAEVTVNYYPMDLEFLFSANPFVAQDTSRFRMIRPGRSERIVLPAGQTTHSFPLPQEYQQTNVLIEVTAAGQSRAVASYANQLEVQVSENYGQLQVRHRGDHRPLSKVYIKVFADIEGRPVFYKDGYTDLRGKFDYTGLSTDDLDRTRRFSILVLDSAHGATVLEVKPPAR